MVEAASCNAEVDGSMMTRHGKCKCQSRKQIAKGTAMANASALNEQPHLRLFPALATDLDTGTLRL